MSGTEYLGLRRHDALYAWISEGLTFGHRGNGAVFLPSFTDLDIYMREIEGMKMMPAFVNLRTVDDVVEYCTVGGANLTLYPMWDVAHLAFAAGSRWPFMIFHDPMIWKDPTLFASLRRQLHPTYQTRTTLITVDTPFPPGYATGAPAESLAVASANAPAREIDYLKITAELSAK